MCITHCTLYNFRHETDSQDTFFFILKVIKNCVIIVQASSKMKLMEKMRALNDIIIIVIIFIIESALSLSVVNVDIQKTKDQTKSRVEIMKSTNQNALNPQKTVIDNIAKDITMINWVSAAMSCSLQQILNQQIMLNITLTTAR